MSKCQKAFDGLKEYLASVPTLSASGDTIELFLYLAATDQTLIEILTKEDGEKVLQQVELNYTPTENMIFVLLMAARN